MVTLIFTLDGQVEVKEGQTQKLKMPFKKHSYVVQFYLKIPKMAFVLICDN